jgi:hypothetical protein
MRSAASMVERVQEPRLALTTRPGESVAQKNF